MTVRMGARRAGPGRSDWTPPCRLARQGTDPDRDTARRELFAYIEAYYNRARIHSAIGYITPQQAEAKAA
jgi:transposase InsO family protein